MSALRMWAFDPSAPAPPREAKAKQVRYALTSLGVRQAFEDAVAKASQDARDWWEYSDPIVEDAPKLARFCAAAGTTPKAVIDVALTN